MIVSPTGHVRGVRRPACYHAGRRRGRTWTRTRRAGLAGAAVFPGGRRGIIRATGGGASDAGGAEARIAQSTGGREGAVGPPARAVDPRGLAGGERWAGRP